MVQRSQRRDSVGCGGGWGTKCCGVGGCAEDRLACSIQDFLGRKKSFMAAIKLDSKMVVERNGFLLQLGCCLLNNNAIINQVYRTDQPRPPDRPPYPRSRLYFSHKFQLLGQSNRYACANHHPQRRKRNRMGAQNLTYSLRNQ
jgi:hypothetical protein